MHYILFLLTTRIYKICPACMTNAHIFSLMKAVVNSFIKHFEHLYVPGPYYQSFWYLSDFLSFLAIVILYCSFSLTNISFCFTSLCLYSHYLCRESLSGICSGTLSLRNPLEEKSMCSIALPKMGKVCLHSSPMVPHAYLTTTLHVIVTFCLCPSRRQT